MSPGQLYAKARAWWASDKDGIALKWFRGSPVLEALADMGCFLSRAIIPPLSQPTRLATSWLLGSRKFAHRVPSHLWHSRMFWASGPEQTEPATNTLAADLSADVRHVVAAAADAVRH